MTEKVKIVIDCKWVDFSQEAPFADGYVISVSRSDGKGVTPDEVRSVISAFLINSAPGARRKSKTKQVA